MTGVEVWSHRASARSTWVMVRVAAGEHAGVGELSDGGPAEDLVAAARSLVEHAVGLPVEAARAAVRERIGSRREGAFLRQTVLGGFEAAFADLGARLAGLPLASSLGLGDPAPVRVYANLNRRWGADGTDVFRREAGRAVAAGYPAVKVAPFSWATLHGATGADVVPVGLDFARQVRAAVPETTGFMVDCHHLVPADLLDAAAGGLAELAPHWVEDLVDLADPAALRAAAATGLPLAGGEHVGDPATAGAACATGALAYWLLDPKHAGGPDGARRIVDAVHATPGVAVTFHNPSGPVGTAHAAHLAALAGPTTWLEVAWGEQDRDALLDPPETITGGAWRPRDAPGIGSAVTQRAGAAS